LPSATPRSLSPRKKPSQARATATLDAIFEATIQLLVRAGPHRLTTTRVAERAGVSVGTMYQYFPHKQALIYALNERYLGTLAGKIEITCSTQHGAPLSQMVEALIDTYWQAKCERPDVTRALYRSVVELDNEELIESFARRVDAATSTMLASAPDASIDNLSLINLTLMTVIFGTVRNAFERNLEASESEAMLRQLVVMCTAYLQAVTGDSKSGPHGA
jgi:AcrR family transcriptional regulator